MFTVETMSGKTIKTEIDTNIADCFNKSIHPYHMISKEIRSVMVAQDNAGDPVSSINCQHYPAEDLLGDEDTISIC